MSNHYYKTALNPCSVESIHDPLKLDDKRHVWPVVVSCYQLTTTMAADAGAAAMSKDVQTSSHVRTGEMNVFLVDADSDGEPLKFGAVHTIEQDSSGILDGKWQRQARGTNTNDDDEYWFATAQSTGRVRLDAFSFRSNGDSEPPFSARHLATSEPLQDAESSALCLSVSWDDWTRRSEEQKQQKQQKQQHRRIVSSYSNGKVAIHQVVKREDTVDFVVEQSWLAHTLFGNVPAEVWTACFATSDANNDDGHEIVLTGGDDTKLKLWDMRAGTSSPMQVLQHFQAGVTAVSTDPKRLHVVAVGSYDETLTLYDVRNASTPLAKSDALGGGIWRIKWHPHQANRLLVAAMHGGCRVVNLEDDNGQLEFRVTQEFTEHESMAYGADWLVRRQSDENQGFVEGAVSCSFYDRAVHLWETT